MLLHLLQELLFMVQMLQFETHETVFKIKAIGNKQAVNRLQNNLQTQLHIYIHTYIHIYAVTVYKTLSYSNSREVYPTSIVRATFFVDLLNLNTGILTVMYLSL